VIACAVDEKCAAAPPTPVPGFETIVVQAVAGFVPGCSGNVFPGAPGSADATAAVAIVNAALARVATARRPSWRMLLSSISRCFYGASIGVPVICATGATKGALATLCADSRTTRGGNEADQQTHDPAERDHAGQLVHRPAAADTQDHDGQIDREVRGR
jgi:hypothetical protein